MSTLFSCSVHPKDSGVQGQSPRSGIRDGGGANPPLPVAETLLLLNVQWKPQICLLFNIRRRKKSHMCVTLHCRNDVQ